MLYLKECFIIGKKKMRVELIDCMGNDLTVVNAARVSFDRWHDKFKDQDQKLINYLAKHHHWTPFAHPHLSFRVTAPVFVRTQCFKHKVGFVENEVSRRYVDTPPKFYSPPVWRGRAKDKKQGSDAKVNIQNIRISNAVESWDVGIDRAFWNVMDECRKVYNGMIEAGVAPEQARMVLPQSMYTQWIWTGSLMAWSRFCKQRKAEDAQREIQLLAKIINNYCRRYFPISWRALLNA